MNKIVDKPKILIADDHPIFRKGLRMIVESFNKYEIISEAENGKEAIEKINQNNPDVAILDVDMPLINGVEVVREFRKTNCQTEFIFLTMFKEKDLFDEAISLGVKGYVLKDSAVSEINDCIAYVLQNKLYLSPSLSSFVIQKSESIKNFQCKNPLFDELTPTELKILKLVADYKSSKEIADELKISVRTVEHHRANVCEKLGLKGSHSLLKFAIENKKFF